MKLTKQKIFTAVFLAALVIPFPLYALFGRFADKTNYENRVMTTLADVADAPLAEKPQLFEDVLNDNAPFRNEFMTLNAAVNLKLFDTIQSGEVLLGSDNWLFYKNVSDSKSLDDYQGLNVYSQDEMQQITDNLSALDAALAAKGIKFVLLIAPNKEGVYSRYMPSSVPNIGETKADVLVNYLAQSTSADVIYPKETLKSVSEAQQVYYKYDTHWNEAGAFYAVEQLMQSLNYSETPVFYTAAFMQGGKTEKTDLANISATYKLLPDDYDYEVKGFLPQVTAQITEQDGSNGYITHCTSNAQSGQTLLMLRDSFGSAMLPTLAKCFDTAEIMHINTFAVSAPKAGTQTVFVWELAERNTARLLDYTQTLINWAQNG